MITVNERKIEYKDGMTVDDALKEAGEPLNNVTLVVIDGKVLPCGQPHPDLLMDGANIKVLPIISGG